MPLVGYNACMNPNHDELCRALVALGAESCALVVRPEVLEHLATLGLVKRESNGWVLTPPGCKLLSDLLHGNEMPPLI
jgi:hypothetical protein